MSAPDWRCGVVRKYIRRDEVDLVWEAFVANTLNAFHGCHLPAQNHGQHCSSESQPFANSCFYEEKINPKRGSRQDQNFCVGHVRTVV